MLYSGDKSSFALFAVHQALIAQCADSLSRGHLAYAQPSGDLLERGDRLARAEFSRAYLAYETLLDLVVKRDANPALKRLYLRNSICAHTRVGTSRLSKCQVFFLSILGIEVTPGQIGRGLLLLYKSSTRL